MKFDPWDDAQILAQRLSRPGSKLVAVVAASAWCQKCRDYLPVFERQAAAAPDNESHVWLDLEDHAVFLGSFVPSDLPLQLIYESGRLTSAVVLRATGNHEAQEVGEPGIHARLCAIDWAD